MSVYALNVQHGSKCHFASLMSHSSDLGQWTWKINGPVAQHVQARVQWRWSDVGETLEVLRVWGSEVGVIRRATYTDAEAAGPLEDWSRFSEKCQSLIDKQQALHPCIPPQIRWLSLFLADSWEEVRLYMRHSIRCIYLKKLLPDFCADCVTYLSVVSSLKAGRYPGISRLSVKNTECRMWDTDVWLRPSAPIKARVCVWRWFLLWKMI